MGPGPQLSRRTEAPPKKQKLTLTIYLTITSKELNIEQYSNFITAVTRPDTYASFDNAVGFSQSGVLDHVSLRAT
jgi:hypothetical protein